MFISNSTMMELIIIDHFCVFQVLERWAKLKDALIQKRAELGESQTLQQFSRLVFQHYPEEGRSRRV